MAQTRERQVCTAHPPVMARGLGKEALARCNGSRRIAVEDEVDLRPGKLHRMEVNDIAPQQQTIIHQPADVARRMAVCCHHPDARQDFHRLATGMAALHPLHAPILHVRGQRCGGLEEGLLELFRKRFRVPGVQPVGRLGVRNPYRSLRIGLGTIRPQQTTDVIRMRVGQQHIRHRGGIDTRTLQRILQLSGGLPKTGSRPGIHQHAPVTPLHQEHIDGRLDAVPHPGDMSLSQRGFQGLGVDALGGAERQRQESVQQRRHAQIADSLPIDPRHLHEGAIDLVRRRSTRHILCSGAFMLSGQIRRCLRGRDTGRTIRQLRRLAGLHRGHGHAEPRSRNRHGNIPISGFHHHISCFQGG